MIVRKSPGATSKGCLASDELQDAGPIGGPNAASLVESTPLPVSLAEKAVWPASFSTGIYSKMK